MYVTIAITAIKAIIFIFRLPHCAEKTSHRMPDANTAVMITAQPDDIKGSAKYRTQLDITAAISTKSTFLSLLDAGIIIAINIAYNVIPIASASDVGSRLFIKAPSTVPSVQPMYGIAISPSINGNVMAIGVVDATANTSSVMPNAVISRFASDILRFFVTGKAT